MNVRHFLCFVTDDCAMFTKHLMSTAELSGVVKDQKRKPSEREVDKDLTPAGKRCVLTEEILNGEVFSNTPD